jgi:hypothetical protein
VELNLKGIVIIVGNYGSGKTEVAVNLAITARNAGISVKIADLDLVNPYFRTREVRGVLSQLGVKVVLPPDMYMHADLPILSPAIAGMIREPAPLTIVDVGGDDAGATVLGSLADVLAGKPIRMIQVINPFRPFTDTIEGCMRIRREIEGASRQKINAIAGNANLIDETTEDTLYQGYAFVQNLSQETGLPLEFVTAASDLLPKLDMNRFSCPVLPIRRQLVPPWKKAAPVFQASGRLVAIMEDAADSVTQ